MKAAPFNQCFGRQVVFRVREKHFHLLAAARVPGMLLCQPLAPSNLESTCYR